MDPEDRIEEASAGDPGTASVGVGGIASRDARSLVERMVAAGEWPEPALMEQIVAAGDEAVEPLLEVLGTEPEGWPEEAPLYNAVGLLSEIRPPRAIPALVDVIRRFKSETGDAAGDAIARYGAEGFEALLELIRDPSIVGYLRLHLITDARQAASEDPGKLSRLAELLRQLFAEIVPVAREYLKGGHRALELDGGDDPDDDVAMNAIPPDEDLALPGREAERAWPILLPAT